MANKQYAIHYKQYSPLLGEFVYKIKVVKTDDIYREIGILIVKSSERIEYILHNTHNKETEEFWLDQGYKKAGRNRWVKTEKAVRTCRKCNHMIYHSDLGCYCLKYKEDVTPNDLCIEVVK